MKDWIKTLREMRACEEALDWCKNYGSLAEAWAESKRGDWMIWLLGKLSGKPESPERKKLVLTACQCARLALPYVKLGEVRPLKAIETAEAWAKGEGDVTLQDTTHAAADAADAAYAAAHSWALTIVITSAAQLSTLEECADIVREYYPVAPELEDK